MGRYMPSVCEARGAAQQGNYGTITTKSSWAVLSFRRQCKHINQTPN
ncbi:hypothetical protein PgNI_06074, partial [Pyricularia grisea]|uniref:Uncharacterized protein n=1 Tax=Pyricularia grisea TaxID=148305 RepID=A0A6P8B741_PYRGI